MIKSCITFWILCAVVPGIIAKAEEKGAKLTLEDIFLTNTYYAYQGPDLHFLYGRDACLYISADSVNIYDYAGKYQETWLTQNTFRRLNGTDTSGFDDVQVWPGNKLLLISEEESIYRYSSRAIYHVYDPVTGKLSALQAPGKVMSPVLSPDGNMVAFIFDNNIYIQYLQNDSLLQVTTDGKEGEIINGHGDWVYEEEFDLLSTMVWTADSRNLVFLSFDESRVPEFSLDKYIGAMNPVEVTYKYPKAGQVVASAKMKVCNIRSGITSAIQLPDSITYIPRIYAFTDPDRIDLITLDRKQQHLNALSYMLSNGAIDVWYTENDSRYVEVPRWVFRDSAGNAYISSEKAGNVMLYRKLSGQAAWEPVTFTGTDITAVYGIGQNGNIYFQRTSGNGRGREVASIAPGKEPVVLFTGGTVEAQFSPDYTTVLVKRSGLDHPFSSGLYRADDGEAIRTVFSSPGLEKMISELGTPFEFTSIPVNGHMMNAWMIKPPGFNKKKKHPVLFAVYGGPGAQNVLDDWDYSTAMWYRYLASKGIIVIAVENRGGEGMGTEIKKCTYGRLGELEVEDQFAAARHFAVLPYIDSSRMAIYGWSYGGFTSLMCLLQDKSPFSAGVAIAPVTHWKLYDAVYTERYMGLFSENKANYEKFAPVNLAQKLKGHLLLVHGTIDDNVHFQQSMEMIRTLNAAGKYYTFLAYPNRDHSIYGGNTRYHLFGNITAFLLQELIR